ncbi:MAG: SMP-30/gluconolactonase/LRE family protein [Chloroflexota bacterium]
MTPELELIANYHCHIGENPLWHPMEKKLYWLDIPTGTIFRYDPLSKTHEIVYRGDVTGGFTIQEDGSLLLFATRGAVHNLRNGSVKTIIGSLLDEENNRFNDVIADPKGRVFCGTMPFTLESKGGHLYRLDLDGSFTKVVDNVGISNGMGFTRDLKTFYHSDSIARTICQYDYDLDSGNISNQRVFTLLPQEYGVPDGMTIDDEGFIWSANWDGWRLVRYDSQANIERLIAFPTKKVSSLIFGGEDYSDIYVTTAGGDNLAENGETAGALYRVRVGIKGRPEYLSNITV